MLARFTRPQTRLPRHIAAALVGLFAAWATWAWPDAPLWQSGPDAGRLEGFSPDGHVVVTTRIPPPNAGLRFPDPEVSRWDAATGTLLSRAVLPCAAPDGVKAARPSPDGRLVLVGEGHMDRRDPTMVPPFSTGAWYLHDGISGARTLGPVRGLAAVPVFSADGRWCWGKCGAARGGREGLRGSAVFSTASGEPVLDFPDRNGKTAVACFFAPDSSSAAVWWRDAKASDAGHEVHIIELPSCRSRPFVLPPRRWLWVTGWDGRYLDTIVNGPEGTPDRPQRCSCVLDLSGDTVGPGVEDPLLRPQGGGAGAAEGWHAGSDWVAFFTHLPSEAPPARTGWWEALASRLGLRRAQGRLPLSAKVWFVDRASGVVRYEVPRPVYLTFKFSPDGRRLAGTTADGGVEVWDTDPPPRWPRALATGWATAAAILGLGWWRRRLGSGRAATQSEAAPDPGRSAGSP